MKTKREARKAMWWLSWGGWSQIRRQQKNHGLLPSYKFSPFKALIRWWKFKFKQKIRGFLLSQRRFRTVSKNSNPHFESLFLLIDRFSVYSKRAIQYNISFGDVLAIIVRKKIRSVEFEKSLGSLSLKWNLSRPIYIVRTLRNSIMARLYLCENHRVEC